MKIRLEKPVVNISKLAGGKMKKVDKGLYMKNFGQIYIVFTGSIEWKSKELNM